MKSKSESKKLFAVFCIVLLVAQPEKLQYRTGMSVYANAMSTDTLTCKSSPMDNSQGLMFDIYNSPYMSPPEEYGNMIYYYGDHDEFNTPVEAILGTPIVTGNTKSIYIDGNGAFGVSITPLEFGIAGTVYGYFIPQLSGKWTFTLSADDIADFYFGDLAICGWDDKSYIITANWVNGENGTVIDLNAGTFYPIRVVWGQSGGPYSLDLTFTDPTGVSYVSGSGLNFVLPIITTLEQLPPSSPSPPPPPPYDNGIFSNNPPLLTTTPSPPPSPTNVVTCAQDFSSVSISQTDSSVVMHAPDWCGFIDGNVPEYLVSEQVNIVGKTDTSGNIPQISILVDVNTVTFTNLNSPNSLSAAVTLQNGSLVIVNESSGTSGRRLLSKKIESRKLLQIHPTPSECSAANELCNSLSSGGPCVGVNAICTIVAITPELNIVAGPICNAAKAFCTGASYCLSHMNTLPGCPPPLVNTCNFACPFGGVEYFTTEDECTQFCIGGGFASTCCANAGSPYAIELCLALDVTACGISCGLCPTS